MVLVCDLCHEKLSVGSNPKLRSYVCHHRAVHKEKFDRMNDGTPDKMIGKKEIRNLDMRLSHEDCDHHQHHVDFQLLQNHVDFRYQ